MERDSYWLREGQGWWCHAEWNSITREECTEGTGGGGKGKQRQPANTTTKSRMLVLVLAPKLRQGRLSEQKGITEGEHGSLHL